MKKDNKQRLFEVMGKLDKSFIPLLNEAQAVPFSLDRKPYQDHNSYNYSFEVDGIYMKCDIFHDDSKHYDGVYEVAFGEKNKGDYHRVGKDLKFMNTVLETVAECVQDFLNREPNVAKLKMEGAVGEGESSAPWDATVRTNAYIRFLKNKFPDMEIKNFGRYIELTIRDKVENEMERMKDVVKTVSDAEDIPEHGLQGSYQSDKLWAFETDFGVNSKKGGFNIEINNDLGNYYVRIELFDTGDEVDESFSSFEDAKNFILNYFN